MTDETTTPEAAAAPVRRTRGRRVATGVATPPSAGAIGAGTAVAAPAGETAPTAEPTGQRARTAPRTGSSAATSTTSGAAAAPSDAPAAEEPAAPRARARRTTRRATAPAAAAPDAATTEQPAAPTEQSAAPAEAAPAAPDAASTPEPAAAPRARRSRRATSASVAEAPSAEPAGVEPTAAEAPADAPAATAEERPARARRRPARGAKAESEGAAPALDVLAELGIDRPAAASAPTAAPDAPAAAEQPAAGGSARGRGETPRLATTALLFQAPDPTARPRRRRASAPAGPPRPEDVVVAEEEVDEDALAVDAGLVIPEDDAAALETGAEDDVVETAETADETSEDEDGGPRRRRRRGGRGRRSRSAGDRETDEQDGAEEAPAEAADDATDADETTGDDAAGGRRRRRSGRGRGAATAEDQGQDQGEASDDEDAEDDEQGEGADGDEAGGSSSRRRRRRRRTRGEGDDVAAPARTRTRAARGASDEVTALKGSTRLEAKRQRRREGRDAGRRRTIVTESEFLARREAVDRAMVVRESDGRVQIAVLEDGVLVEHFVSRTSNGQSQASMAGNVYLGRVQNVLPSMEAAFVDVGKGRNAVLYAGEVNWDAAGLEGQPRRIEQALKSGDSVLVQVTKDPIGHKGARLTSQITLAGRYLVYVPSGGMTGISRKLPENERARLKKLLKEIVPDAAGVIVRTAAEGASEEELRSDVQRLQDQWAAIEKKAKSASAPALLQGEPDLAIRVVRDIFNDDFSSLVVQGDGAWSMISEYVGAMAPDLVEKVSRWTGQGDVFGAHRIDEQLAKGMDRKVYLPSGGSLVIDRTEAMTVVDVNTGKFTGSGGTLEETVTRNNLEAAEEIVRQLRLRDIGGIIVIDFIDMVLESNRDLVLRRLVECLGRDRTKHQVAEVTSLGLVQMTRKRVGQGLVEAFSETCQHCNGRGFLVHAEPVEARGATTDEARPAEPTESKRSRRKKGAATAPPGPAVSVPVLPEAREAVKATLATIAAAAAHAHEHPHEHAHDEQPHDEHLLDEQGSEETVTGTPTPDPQASEDQPAGQDAPATDAGDAELGDALSSIQAVEAPVAPVAEGDAGTDGTDDAGGTAATDED